MIPLSKTAYAIVMFAYNEGERIALSLASLHAACDSGLTRALVIANGCTDDTADQVRLYKSNNGFDALELVELSLGDKCNAWNYYVHELAGKEACHFFVDADVRFSTSAFPQLAQTLVQNEAHPHIVAGMPLSGRNASFYRTLVTDRSCFFGNLYGASAAYLELVRKRGFRLPIGLNWIDSFLTKAANTDLDFGDDNLPNRVTFADGVGFYVDSLKPWRIADIKLYKNRIARYELGKLQELFLDKLPACEWPRTMDTINEQISDEFSALTRSIHPIKRHLIKRRLHRLRSTA